MTLAKSILMTLTAVSTTVMADVIQMLPQDLRADQKIVAVEVNQQTHAVQFLLSDTTRVDAQAVEASAPQGQEEGLIKKSFWYEQQGPCCGGGGYGYYPAPPPPRPYYDRGYMYGPGYPVQGQPAVRVRRYRKTQTDVYEYDSRPTYTYPGPVMPYGPGYAPDYGW